ncbi:MAG: hypothetical protein HYV09_20190 [Deltaproteobacteria bacterium]|nr:hypothetical protein [Deltaproteobacteria bacterium]
MNRAAGVAAALLLLQGAACSRTPEARRAPEARGGGPPSAPAVTPAGSDVTPEDARAVVARVRCSMAASCAGGAGARPGDTIDACTARARADLAGWPGCAAIDRPSLEACVAAVRDAACEWRALPLVCAPESVCK